MRLRLAEIVSFVVCVALLLIIPLAVAIIVASPFVIYHFIIHGWALGLEDLKGSSRLIGYFWGLLVGTCLLWSLVTHFWNRSGGQSALISPEKQQGD